MITDLQEAINDFSERCKKGVFYRESYEETSKFCNKDTALKLGEYCESKNYPVLHPLTHTILGQKPEEE